MRLPKAGYEVFVRDRISGSIYHQFSYPTKWLYPRHYSSSSSSSSLRSCCSSASTVGVGTLTRVTIQPSVTRTMTANTTTSTSNNFNIIKRYFSLTAKQSQGSSSSVATAVIEISELIAQSSSTTATRTKKATKKLLSSSSSSSSLKILNETDTVVDHAKAKATVLKKKKLSKKDDLEKTVDDVESVRTVVKPRKSRAKKGQEEATTLSTTTTTTTRKKTAISKKTSGLSTASSTSTTSSSSSSSSSSPTPTTTATATSTVLRDYQQQCIDACLTNLEKGIKRQIVSLPVGSGKTVIFSHLMQKVPEPFSGAKKTLILAHREELLQQTKKHVLMNGSGLTVSIDQGKSEADMSCDVIIGSVPTLGRLGTTRLQKYNPKEFKCIIIDEAHHAAASSYGRILTHFGADHESTLNNTNHIFVYGCSATIRRHDGLKLGHVFDYISFHKDFLGMIQDGWLCGLRVKTIQTEFSLEGVKIRNGDFGSKELSTAVNTPLRNEIVVRSFMTFCKDRFSTVVFAVDIEHLETLTKVFRDYGYDARGLSSRTDGLERQQLLQDFRARKFPVIVNCGILTEGTDIPAIDSILMARPTKSNVLFQQMLGRGMRLFVGKKDCLVLDFVDSVKGDGLVTVPTLLGLDPGTVLDQQDKIENLKDVERILDQEEEHESIQEIDGLPNDTKDNSSTTESNPQVFKVARIKVMEYDNPYQLLDDCSGTSSQVWSMSNNAWVCVGPETFILTFQGTTFRIEQSEKDGLYRCLKRVTVGASSSGTGPVKSFRNGAIQFRRPKRNQAGDEGGGGGEGGNGANVLSGPRILSKGTYLPIESDRLQDCFHGVDTWIAKNIGHFPELIGRFAKWRKLPATEAQLRFLKKLGWEPNNLDETFNKNSPGEVSLATKMEAKAAKKNLLKTMTKGQAANVITRFVNGAGKRWEEHVKEQESKKKKKKMDIGVDVGPISSYVDV